MSAEQNKHIVRRWVEGGWNNGNLDLVDEMYAPDYQPRFLPEGFPSGRDGLKAFVAHYRAAMPDLHFQLDDITAEEDRVAWRFTATGTQTGELFGIPATGRRLEVGGIVISTFRDALWSEDQAQYDTYGMLVQLGVIPQPEAATA